MIQCILALVPELCAKMTFGLPDIIILWNFFLRFIIAFHHRYFSPNTSDYI
jgi:hypothetical protein